MIKHILSIIWAQRKTNSWIGIELLFVFVFLWFIVDNLLVTGYMLALPKGFHIEHTYHIALSTLSEKSSKYIPLEQKTTTTGEDIQVIADRIRTYPGVEAVSFSRRSHPYTNNFSWSQQGTDTTRYVNVRRRSVSPGYFAVFGIQTMEGKPVLPELLTDNAVVITKDMGKELFGESSPVGQMIHTEGDRNIQRKIVAVTSSIRDSEYEKYEISSYDVITPSVLAEMKPTDLYAIDLCIRVSSGSDRDFAARFRRDMATQLSVGNIFLLDVKPIADYRSDYIRENRDTLYTQLAVFFFLLLNIFLGIIGTFWVRTESRKAELGLRMALGGTPSRLMYHLMEEGLLLLVLAAIPAIVICINLGIIGIVETSLLDFTAIRFCLGTLVTFVLMALMIVTGVWYPARQTAKIQSAEALHYE